MKKIGRNEPCHCGSGEKYKKCCLGKTTQSTESAKKRDSSNTATSNIQNKQCLLETTTQEFHMPVRLYYQVYDKAQLLAALNQLQCIELVVADRWHLTYDQEAKEFGLSVKYKEVPKELFPLILGYIHLANDELLHIDVRSFKRAASMIEFIDRHIDRQLIKVTHAATYNELLIVTELHAKAISHGNLDNFFLPENMGEIHPEVIKQELEAIADGYENQDEKLDAVFSKLASDARRKHPFAEKFPIHFYEDGIAALKCTLAIKETVAVKHAQGNKSYSKHDAVMDIVNKMTNKPGEEYALEKTCSTQLERLPEGNSMAIDKKQQEKSKPTCGLCGSSSKKLTKTECCDNWICNDEDSYVMFSHTESSCYRNHDRYTLCSYHYNENHPGRWQDCKKCKDDFESHDYIEMSTNNHNFEALETQKL